jgi:outer membrane protein assembly factor BamA
MYRVKLGAPRATRAGAGVVNVAVAVEEGAVFTLGEVKMTGDEAPVAAMLKAGAFERGKTANWTRIERGVWEAEKPLKRQGYYQARVQPKRLLDDARRVLDVELGVTRGALFHTGKVDFRGLTLEQYETARRLWRMQPGDPFDYLYPWEFLAQLGEQIELALFRKKDVQLKPGAGQNVIDVTLDFVGK